MQCVKCLSYSRCSNPGCQYDENVSVITPLRTKFSSHCESVITPLRTKFTLDNENGVTSKLPSSPSKVLPTEITVKCCRNLQDEHELDMLVDNHDKIIIKSDIQQHQYNYRFCLPVNISENQRKQIYNVSTHDIDLFYTEKLLIGDLFIDVLQKIVFSPCTAVYFIGDIHGWHKCHFE